MALEDTKAAGAEAAAEIARFKRVRCDLARSNADHGLWWIAPAIVENVILGGGTEGMGFLAIEGLDCPKQMLSRYPLGNVIGQEDLLERLQSHISPRGVIGG